MRKTWLPEVLETINQDSEEEKKDDAASKPSEGAESNEGNNLDQAPARGRIEIEALDQSSKSGAQAKPNRSSGGA